MKCKHPCLRLELRSPYQFSPTISLHHKYPPLVLSRVCRIPLVFFRKKKTPDTLKYCYVTKVEWRIDETITLANKKITPASLLLKRFEIVSERVRQRDKDEGLGQRLAEDCYIDTFLFHVVSLCSGSYFFASLSRGS